MEIEKKKKTKLKVVKSKKKMEKKEEKKEETKPVNPWGVSMATTSIPSPWSIATVSKVPKMVKNNSELNHKKIKDENVWNLSPEKFKSNFQIKSSFGEIMKKEQLKDEDEIRNNKRSLQTIQVKI